MIDKTCSNCFYWENWHKGLKRCDAIYLSFPEALERKKAIVCAEVHDESGLDAVLLTSADFSCSLWADEKA